MDYLVCWVSQAAFKARQWATASQRYSATSILPKVLKLYETAPIIITKTVISIIIIIGQDFGIQIASNQKYLLENIFYNKLL